jgi:hypothetical protein
LDHEFGGRLGLLFHPTARGAPLDLDLDAHCDLDFLDKQARSLTVSLLLHQPISLSAGLRVGALTANTYPVSGLALFITPQVGAEAILFDFGQSFQAYGSFALGYQFNVNDIFSGAYFSGGLGIGYRFSP